MKSTRRGIRPDNGIVRGWQAYSCAGREKPGFIRFYEIFCFVAHPPLLSGHFALYWAKSVGH